VWLFLQSLTSLHAVLIVVENGVILISYACASRCALFFFLFFCCSVFLRVMRSFLSEGS